MPVHYTTKGAIATFTIENGTVNPFTPEMHRQFHHAMVEFLGDDSLRVGVLTGAGDRAFSAGDDIKSPTPGSGSPLEDLTRQLAPGHRLHPDRESYSWERDLIRLERFKPVIGAIRGWCLGQGLILLLLLTDLRVATEDAKFGFPEIAYGMGGAGGLTRLGRHLPHAVAMRMLLTGEPIDAAEALRFGLVNQVVPAETLLDAARQLADRIARIPPLAVRVEMEAFHHGLDAGPLEAIRVAEHLYRLQRLAMGGDETVEEFHRPDSGNEARKN